MKNKNNYSINFKREAFANLDPEIFIRAMQDDYDNPFICKEMGDWLRFCYADILGTKLNDPKKTIRILQVYRTAGKTNIATILGIAWAILIKPNISIGLYTKRIDLALAILNEIGSYLARKEYVDIFNEIYETKYETLLTTDKVGTKQMKMDLFTKRGKDPTITAMAVEKTVTGAHFDLIVCDDIVSSEEATSLIQRETTNNLVKDLIGNICVPSGGCVFIGTPHHKADAYQELDNSLSGGKTKYFEFQFRKYPAGTLSKDTPERLQAMYEQAMTLGGELFWSQHYLLKILDNNQVEPFVNINRGEIIHNRGYENTRKVIAAIDPAYAGIDNTAVTILFTLKSTDKIYILGKLWLESALTVVPDIVNFLLLYKVSKVYIENNKDEGYLIDSVKREYLRRGERVGVEAVRNTASKSTRIYGAISPRLDDLFLLPKESDKEFIRQIVEWNMDANIDDAPDALALGLKEGFGIHRKKNKGRFYFFSKTGNETW